MVLFLRWSYFLELIHFLIIKSKLVNFQLEDDDADDDDFEKIVDNDDGEDELLQKLSEKNYERIEETESPKEESSSKS